jgi:hypothetical protein
VRRTISWQRPVDRAISAGAPPPPIPIAGTPIIGITPTDADVDKACTVTQRIAPTARVRVVDHMKTPSKRTWIVINGSDPGTINVARSVYDGAIVSVSADVARRVAHVNDRGSGAVDLNVAHIVNRTARRNRFDRIGDAVSDDPRPFGARSNEPYGIVANVVLATDLENR